MPSWATTTMYFKKKDQYEGFKEKYCTRGNSESKDALRFDFNKVTPMPKELDVPSGIDGDEIMYNFLSDGLKKTLPTTGEGLIPLLEELLPGVLAFPECLDKEFINGLSYEYIVEKILKDKWNTMSETVFKDKDNDEVTKAVQFIRKMYLIFSAIRKGMKACSTPETAESFKESMAHNNYPDSFEDNYHRGRAYVSNILKYGAPDWYEWACYYWGTKWNASESKFNDEDMSVFFCSAWSIPWPVFDKIAADNPEWEITFDSFCETDYMVTSGKFANGEASITGRVSAYDEDEDEDGADDGDPTEYSGEMDPAE